MSGNSPKYDVVQITKTKEGFPTFFLADNQAEAEEIYLTFSSTLNYWAYNYALATGLNKGDLFSEALIGLAKAKRDFDPDRSSNFRNFAIQKIKDELNRHVRKFHTIVSVPAYIKNANRNVYKLIDLLLSNGASNDTINTILTGGKTEVPEHIADECDRLITYLEKAAIRAKVTFVELVDRSGSLPSSLCYEDEVEVDSDTEEQMYAALVVESLKKYMTDIELEIAESIMEGKTYKEIGEEHNRSDAWVAGKLKKMRERLLKKIQM